jgi:hypothetical protein
MRCGKVIKYHIATGRLAKLICDRLRMARGNLYTLKPKHLCIDLFFGTEVPFCSVKVREYLLKMLGDAVVYELSRKDRVVVQVSKAREILACEQRMGEHEGS